MSSRKREANPTHKGLDLFDKILKPALGCTEPAAVALAVAAAQAVSG
jgi:L-cysteine desulfidase